MDYTESSPCLQLSLTLPLTVTSCKDIYILPALPAPKMHTVAHVCPFLCQERHPLLKARKASLDAPWGSQGIYSPAQPPTGHREISTEPSALSSCSAALTLWGPPAPNSCCGERRQKPPEGGASSGGADMEEDVKRRGKGGNPAATPGAPASLPLPLWNHGPLYTFSAP